MTATLKSVYATLPHTERARAMVLNGDPKGKNFLYCNGKHVVIRDINNPSIAETYSQHSYQATVAQYSPSGYYIASGDVSGKIRVWDTVNKEHILKFEAQPFSGPIRDLCWDSESKRIAAGGQGRETYGSVFMWDSGSSIGKIVGHSSVVNSISYKHTRPFRVVTGSEDYSCGFFEGPPFKMTKHLQTDHSNFVNCVRFSPSGSHFCSVSSDRTALLFDGKTGEKVGMLGSGETSHNGGIYSVCWSPDGSQVLTASADKTCKLWDVSTRQEISVFNCGTNIVDQQLGCLWQGDHILSCSLSGNINYLDKNNPNKPLRILEGQNKNLVSICASPDGSYIYCGSNDGRISYWNTDNGDVSIIKGDGHSNKLICSLVATQDNLYSLGFDKALRKSTDFEFTSSDVVSFPDTDPLYLAMSSDGLSLVITNNQLFLVRDGKQLQSIPAIGDVTCAVFNPVKPEVAVGAKNSTVTIYSTENDSLTKSKEFSVVGEVSTLDYDPKGEHLAVGGSAMVVKIFNAETCEAAGKSQGHTGRVTCMKYSSDGKYIISSGIDTNIVIHDLEKQSRNIFKGAHPLSVVNDITWVNDTTFATCAEDCCIRVWEFTR